MEHKCIMQDRIRNLEIETEVQKNNINVVREDVKDIKSTIKDIDNKMNAEFKKNDEKHNKVLGVGITILIGVIIDILLRIKWG